MKQSRANGAGILRACHDLRSAWYSSPAAVVFEGTGDVVAAIAREKQISGGARRRKTALIDGINPDWRDLHDGLC